MQPTACIHRRRQCGGCATFRHLPASAGNDSVEGWRAAGCRLYRRTRQCRGLASCTQLSASAGIDSVGVSASCTHRLASEGIDGVTGFSSWWHLRACAGVDSVRVLSPSGICMHASAGNDRVEVWQAAGNRMLPQVSTVSGFGELEASACVRRDRQCGGFGELLASASIRRH